MRLRYFRFRAGRRIAASVLGLVAILAVAGCETTRPLSDAQTAFSEAAAIENATDADKRGLEAIASASYVTPFQRYQEANAILATLVAEQSNALQADGLLGSAYALRAMALWRLAGQAPGEPRESEARPDCRSPLAGASVSVLRACATWVAQKALDEPAGAQLGSRDLLMMRLLPYLLDHDAGLRLIKTNPDRAHAFLQAAFEGIAQTLNRYAGPGGDIPATHDVVVYARMAQVQTLIAWNAAVLKRWPIGDVRNDCRAYWVYRNLDSVQRELTALGEARSIAPEIKDFLFERTARMGLNAIRWQERISNNPGSCEWR